MARYFTAANTEWLNGGTTTTAMFDIMPFSMFAWVYSVSASATQTIFVTERTVSTVHGHGLLLVSGNAWALTQANSATSAQTAYTANQWQAITGVWNGDASRYIYVGTTRVEDTTSKSPNAGLNWATRIGQRGYNDQPFDGRIAEVAYWNTNLLDADVAALADGVCPLLIRPGNIVSYTPLGGRYSADDADIDTFGEVGTWTATNTPTTAGHPPIIYPTSSSATFAGAAPPAATNYPLFHQESRFGVGSGRFGVVES